MFPMRSWGEYSRASMSGDDGSQIPKLKGGEDNCRFRDNSKGQCRKSVFKDAKRQEWPKENYDSSLDSLEGW